MSVIGRLGVTARIASRLRQPVHRSYGTAAAQLDYEHYYDCEKDQYANINRRVMAASANSITMRSGIQWVIMGDPMVRRHAHAERLAKLLNVPHISMGVLVRQELNPTSPLHKTIASAVDEGKLVPEEIIFDLLSKRLEEGHERGESGFILDGIPRTRVQAVILDQFADIDLVVNLKCTEESVMKKKTLASRIFSEQMKPLEEYYRNQRRLLEIQVAGGPGNAWQSLLAALHLQHIDAADPSQKMRA